jgi:VanZ family protein
MWIIVTVVLATLTLRGSRAAYLAYMLYAVLFIPARAGFQMQPLLCEYPVSVASGLYSLQKWGHILPSAIVSLMSVVQFRKRGLAAFSTALVITVALGFLAELEQGFFRDGNCRMRDLVPDTAGAILGLVIAFAWWRVRRPASPSPSPASGA